MSEHLSAETVDDEHESSGEEPAEEEAVPTDHLDDMEDGCGCAEVWEHLSERRETETGADD